MRAQVFFYGGMLDQQILGIGTEKGEWPTEIRAASGRSNEGEGPVEADCYRLNEVEKQGPVWVGDYTFVGNKLTARTLVYVWTKE